MNRSSSTWEAANVTKRSRKSSLLSPRRGGDRRGSREADRGTLEAMLNRLSKAYNTAMECIGALHRADNYDIASSTTDTATISEEEQTKKWTILCRVGRVARRTLEQGILVDPLVGPHAAAVWTAGIQQQQQQQSDCCSTWIRPLTIPAATARPLLTSAEQERTVQQIAYLALVNYADLLWSASNVMVVATQLEHGQSTDDDSKTTSSVLDRGIVAQLKHLRRDTTKTGCWNDDNDKNNKDDGDGVTPMNGDAENNKEEKCRESPEQTLQLIVWALMDATALDGSDPLVWLKLACACRRLGKCQGDVYRFRVLERHALEQGIAARPQAPNRRLLRAFEEWQAQQQAHQDRPCNVVAPPPPVAKQHLELPRYSWAVLGRILLRACRGETHQSSMSTSAERFSAVSLAISPLLALPAEAVMKPIISYLDESSYCQLKQACRTLSMLRFEATKAKEVSGETAPGTAAGSATTEAMDTSTTEPGGKTDTVPPKEESAPAPPPPPQPIQKTSKFTSASSKEAAQGSRVSKRLRSQIITSGKRTERSNRRASVDYCVYAIVLGIPPPSSSADEKDDSRGQVPSHKDGSRPTATTDFNSISVKRSNISEQEQRRMEASERIGPGSLTAFVDAFLDESHPPISLLFSYLSHVSIYADHVFSNDHHGTIVLLSSVTDCLDVMLKRTQSYQGLTPTWSTNDYQVPAGARLAADQILAIDLLHAELRFKRCDREDQHVTDVDFDSDASVVERLVPALGGLLEQISNTVVPIKQWNSLRVRYQWLVAGYYLWRSRISHDVAESREAEQEGLECIKDIIKLIQELDIPCVPTPHLEGIGRSGEIWKELSVTSLTAFQNKVQASSVVLKAQEQFIDAVSSLGDSDDPLTEDEANRFVGISSYLLERYSSPVDSPESNYLELLDDFMGTHGATITSFRLENAAMELRKWFAGAMPTLSIERNVLKSMTEPCILSILVTCIQLSGKTDRTLHLLWNLIRTLERYQRKVLESTKGDLRLLEDDPQADGMSDDFSLMSEDEEPDTGNLSTLVGYARLLGLLIEAFEKIFRESQTSAQVDWVASQECTCGVEEIFKVCSNQPPAPGRGNGDAGNGENECDSSVAQFILERLGALLSTMDGVSTDTSLQIKCLHVTGLASVLVSQENSLKALLRAPAHQKNRYSWVSQTNAITKEIGHVCLSLGRIVSTDLATVDDEGRMVASTIIQRTLVDGTKLSVQQLSSTLLSLFHFSRSKIREVAVQDFLLVPVAAALIGFCGSAACTKLHGELLCALIDFVDSDESAAEWMDDDDDQEQPKYEQMLRVVTQVSCSQNSNPLCCFHSRTVLL